MIVDDIQVGNGRSGSFFSFERANIIPDMVVLSKSISGFGMPMALLLMKPELDIFLPAEHNGTFRGNQLSFVGGTAGLRYFVSHKLDEEVKRKQEIIRAFLEKEIQTMDDRIEFRGMGLLWGIELGRINPKFAIEVVHTAFECGLICEVAGRKDGVLKLMPPLTIEDSILKEGLSIVRESLKAVLKK